MAARASLARMWGKALAMASTSPGGAPSGSGQPAGRVRRQQAVYQGRANRVTTQSQILRRVAQVIIVIAGLVTALMT